MRILSGIQPDWHLRGRSLPSRILGLMVFALTGTATANETSQIMDLGFRRSVMTEADRLTLLAPRFAALSLQHANSAAPPSAELRDHIRPVDLMRLAPPRKAHAQPLIFLDNSTLFPENPLTPALTLARATQTLMLRMTRFEGRTINPSSGAGNTPMRADIRIAALNPDGRSPVSMLSGQTTPAPRAPEILAASRMGVALFTPQIAISAPIHRTPAKAAQTTSGKADYLALIAPGMRAAEEKCLAEAVYFEARSESETGQAAVAQVVLNRVQSGIYPTSICGVVYQNRHRFKACQFTFACEGKSLATNEPEPWARAQAIANAVLEGRTFLRDVGASTHYHANYVAPWWSRHLKRTDQIGRHIFYRLKPGQT